MAGRQKCVNLNTNLELCLSGVSGLSKSEIDRLYGLITVIHCFEEQ
jgi:hypothetical protein